MRNHNNSNAVLLCVNVLLITHRHHSWASMCVAPRIFWLPRRVHHHLLTDGPGRHVGPILFGSVERGALDCADMCNAMSHNTELCTRECANASALLGHKCPDKFASGDRNTCALSDRLMSELTRALYTDPNSVVIFGYVRPWPIEAILGAPCS